MHVQRPRRVNITVGTKQTEERSCKCKMANFSPRELDDDDDDDDSFRLLFSVSVPFKSVNSLSLSLSLSPPLCFFFDLFLSRLPYFSLIFPTPVAIFPSLSSSASARLALLPQFARAGS